MKRNLLIFLIVTVVFLLLTKLTSINESSFDGDDRIGFPLKFYTFHGGKLIDKAIPPVSYNYTNLIINILVYIAILAISFVVFRKKKK